MKIVDKDVEELRLELCLMDLDLFLVRKRQILQQCEAIKHMLERQEAVHRDWNIPAKK